MQKKDKKVLGTSCGNAESVVPSDEINLIYVIGTSQRIKQIFKERLVLPIIDSGRFESTVVCEKAEYYVLF